MIISILGPQGSGKGTQAELLVKKNNLFYVDMGAHLREIAKNDPQIDEVINKRGELLDDNQVFKILTEYLESESKEDDLLFDGYPRSEEQFNMISNWLMQKGKKIDLFFFLMISDEVAIKRLSARRINKKTGEIYNVITNPPPDNVDPSDLFTREDDKPEAIKERLEAYHKTTQPLLDFLKKTSPQIVHEINGEESIEKISEQIDEIVSNLNG